MADKARWKGSSGFAALAIASVILLALNFRGRTPLNDAALALLEPAIALAGAADRPAMSGETPSDPELPLLRAKNARLSHEVARLRETLEAVSGSRFDGKRYPFRGVPAQALAGMGDGNPRRMIILDRGTTDGVAPGMGIVAGDRVIGLVLRSNDELSIALLLTDPVCKVRCTLLPAESAADATTDREIECLCEGIPEQDDAISLLHVPFNAKTAPGQDVVTSGRGGAFPAGLHVGTIQCAGQGFGLFQEIRVKPAISGERISSVMILVPCLPGAGSDSRGAGPNVLAEK